MKCTQKSCFRCERRGVCKHKVCPGCNKKKRLTDYQKDRCTRLGVQVYCRTCQRKKCKAYYHADKKRANERQRDWRMANPDRFKIIQRRRHLKLKYGMSLEDFQHLVVRQHGLCKICGRLPDQRGLVVDHNHETGEVRGLLCNSCNSAIGHFQEDVGRMRAAVAYLQA